MQHRAILLATVLAASVVRGAPLDIAVSGFPDINCLFAPTCSVAVSDFSTPISLVGGVGAGQLQSRVWTIGQPGTPGAGLYAYFYRLDLVGVRGLLAVPCVTGLSLDFGFAQPLDYDGDGASERVVVGTFGGPGSAGPTSAQTAGDEISLQISVCGGATSYFFGMASRYPPRTTEGTLVDNQGKTYTVEVRTPRLPRFLTCTPRSVPVTGPGYYPVTVDCVDEETGTPLDARDGLRYSFEYRFPDPLIENAAVGPQQSNTALMPIHSGEYLPTWTVEDINGVYATWFESTGDCVPPPPFTPSFGATNSRAVHTDDLVANGQPSIAGTAVNGIALGGSSASALTDGTVYAGGTPANTTGLSSFVPAAGSQWTVNLNTAFSPEGYDISAVKVLSADPSDREQSYSLEVKRRTDPGFVVVRIVGSASDACGPPSLIPTNGFLKELEVDVSWDTQQLLAEGVEAVRFTFHAPTAYREIDVLGTPSGATTNPTFVRGDCNTDGTVDVSDALRALGFAFLGQTLACADACDFNADGEIDITNALFFLRALFFGASPIAPPRSCGSAAPLRGCLGGTCEA